MNKQLKAVAIMIRATHSLEEILRIDIESYGINTTEFGVLEYLYHKGAQPMQNIGGKLLMANSSITYVIDKLQVKKYIKRVIDQDDRRKTNVELTALGTSFFESIFPNHQNKVSQIFSVLTNQELQEMMDLLKKVGYYSNSLKVEGD